MNERSRIKWPSVLRLGAWVCLLVAASATQAAEVANSASVEPGALLRLAGRLHPLIVHFPIALLLTALIVESWRMLRRSPRPSATALTCLALGVLAAGGAIGTGLANAEYESHSQSLAAAIDRHQLWGIITGSVGAAALLVGLLALAWDRRALRWTYFIALLGAGVLTGVTGHMGGSLVYGDDYLTSVLWPESKAPAPAPDSTIESDPPDDAVSSSNSDSGPYYDPDIKAIVAARCENCHGPSRQRGGLRLDRYAELFGADQSLWVVQPLIPEQSEMVRRIRLPEDDDDAMPPKGERLSAGQIALIETWIANGAPEIAANHSSGDAPEQPAKSSEPAEPSVDHSSEFTVPTHAEVDWASIKSADPARAADALARLGKAGAAVNPIARGTDAVDINFSVAGSAIEDRDLAALAGLEDTLVWLNLAGASVTNDGIAPLARFRQLRRLHLERTAISDGGLEAIAELPNLEYLNLYGTAVSDAGLTALERLPALREVYLWQTQVSAEGVGQFRRARPEVAVASPWSDAPQSDEENKADANKPESKDH